MIGADICGFVGNTTVDLCARWQSFGAFYPFSRNHNDIGTENQDPGFMGGVVLNATKNALELRYQLLPYLYTLFYEAHTTGSPVIRGLFMEFPKDMKARGIDTQLMWGPAIMIVPVLEQDKTSREAYYPQASWYGIRTYKLESDKAQTKTIEVPQDKIKTYLRSGHIILKQESGMNTQESRNTPFTLLGALEDGKAVGSIYWDDGDSMYTIETGQFTLVKVSIADKTLSSNVELAGYQVDMHLQEVVIMGVEAGTKSATIDGKKVPADSFSIENNQVMILSNLKLDLKKRFVIKWQ